MKALIEHASPALLSRARFVARALVVAFVLVCVFDPADRMLGLKVWVFLALWPATLAVAVLTRGTVQLPVDLLIITLLFILIPVLSIAWYYLVSGVEPYAGFALLKSYLFVSLAIILFVNQIDVLPILSAALTVLALFTIAIFVALSLYPDIFDPIHEWGVGAGIFLVSYRSYGPGLSFTQVAFATAPMLAIAISYYFDCAMSGAEKRQRLAYWGLTALGILAMLMVGLRNTMAVALLLPSFLWPLYTRRPGRNALISLAMLIALSLPFIGKLRAFLDPAELSNNTKLTFLGDYARIFSDPVNLIFGQGLGAFYKWSTSGLPDFETTGSNFYFISELTYPEMIRSFGLVGATIMLALVLYPVGRAFLMRSTTTRRAQAIGFLAYLGMSATNPLLFSSSGMLIWAALVVASFRENVPPVAGRKA
ncbi:hypothetical protein [Bradyrhizobium sp.]|uniref:hypothetical protein n=1 Tax=Bradyrhizobium sp. TaxID=376 RepID=UPI002DDD3E34|nr:hypothetical protein [Bradyrhizobium sp.]HEV2154871.1 hypothetical protein [Bradyrhizobium sp.]